MLTEPGCDGYIQTVRGFGYRLAPPSCPPSTMDLPAI